MTSQPLVKLTGIAPQALAGLNEVTAGVLEGLPMIPFGLTYLLGTVAWIFGFPAIPTAPRRHPRGGVLPGLQQLASHDV